MLGMMTVKVGVFFFFFIVLCPAVNEPTVVQLSVQFFLHAHLLLCSIGFILT